MKFLPKDIFHEIQRLVAIEKMDTISKESTLSKEGRQEKMVLLLHGTEGIDGNMGGFEQFVTGIGCYNQCFTEVLDAKDSSKKLLLKQEFTRDDSLNLFFSKTDFWVAHVHGKFPSSGEKDRIGGRAAIDKVNRNCISNCKKAIATGKKFLNADGNIPSGKSEEDYFEFVLDRMFEIDHNLESNALDGDKNDENKPVRPPNYMFEGYFAFRCFGPMAENCYRNVNFLEKGMPSISKKRGKENPNSRVATRDRELKAASNAREFTTGGDDIRGVNLSNRIDIHKLAFMQNKQRSMKERDFFCKMKLYCQGWNVQCRIRLKYLKLQKIQMI